MVKKMIGDDLWAVWNDDIGFYVDTRMSRQEMIDKHTSDLGMTWAECRKAGDKVVRVVMKAAEQGLHPTKGSRATKKPLSNPKRLSTQKGLS